jgi:hypothetical protein
MHKDSIHKVTIIIRASNKMSLIYGYLIDWSNRYDWSIHFHNRIGHRPHHKNKHIILYCILYMTKEQNIASYGDNSWLLRSVQPVLKCCGSRLLLIAHLYVSCSAGTATAFRQQLLHFSVCYCVFIFIMARPRTKHSRAVATYSLHMTWTAGIDT